MSGSADGRTSVLFSLKSVIFLSRLDGNVPTDVTGSDHPSFIQYRKRERGERGGMNEDQESRTDTLAGFPGIFMQIYHLSHLKSGTKIAYTNEISTQSFWDSRMEV